MSATSDIHAGPEVLEVPRPAGIRTFFIWIGLSLLGFPLGGYIDHTLSLGEGPPMEGGAGVRPLPHRQTTTRNTHDQE